MSLGIGLKGKRWILGSQLFRPRIEVWGLNSNFIRQELDSGYYKSKSRNQKKLKGVFSTLSFIRARLLKLDLCLSSKTLVRSTSTASAAAWRGWRSEREKKSLLRRIFNFFVLCWFWVEPRSGKDPWLFYERASDQIAWKSTGTQSLFIFIIILRHTFV